MSKNNIFIIHTIFQKISADVIVENFIPENYKNIAIIILDGDFNTNLKSNKWFDVIEIDGKNINTWTGLTPMKVKRIYNNIKYTDREFNLYISNVNFPISNTFYKNSIKRNLDIHGYPEGLANLVDEEDDVKRKFKQFTKYLYGGLLLNTFYIYGNKYWGEKIKSKFETKTITKKLKLNKGKGLTKYLYLGGMKTDGKDIRKLCDDLGISKKEMEIKLHPRSIKKINDFNIIESNISAEELFLENNFSVVLGEGSSALYHIKCISPNTEVICIRYNDTQSTRRNKIDKLFTDIGIKMLRSNTSS